MRKEFMVERQGKTFCLYAGLLDLAHQNGLQSIKTSLIQIPHESNNRTAICSATVILLKNDIEMEFTGIGDSSPNNVAPAMQNCLIRMAETRAKARALRDAVNIGVAAFEELGDVDAHDGAPERGYQTGAGLNRNSRPARQAEQPRVSIASAPAAQSPPQSQNNRPAVEAGAEVGATESQLEAIRSLCKRQAQDPEAFVRDTLQIQSLAALSQTQASELIRQLNSRKR